MTDRSPQQGETPPGPARGDDLRRILAGYWRPIYVYVRCKGNKSTEDAKELTQSFLADAPEKAFHIEPNQGGGQFRTLLKKALDTYMADPPPRRAATRKTPAVDMSNPPSPAEDAPPEELYRAEWIHTTFTHAIEDLKRACEAQGNQTTMKVFERHQLASEDEVSYESVARDLGLKLWDVTNCLADARHRLREMINARVREYASTEEDFRQEMSELLAETTNRAVRKLQRMLSSPTGKPAASAQPGSAGGQMGKYKLLRMLAPQSWEVSDGLRPNTLVLRVVGTTRDQAVIAAVCGALKPLAALQHPVIVTYHKLSTCGGNYFTVRDYVQGQSFDPSKMDPMRALQVIHLVAQAIEFIHQRGLAHGALKATNIIISPDGHPLLVDFAIYQIIARFQGDSPSPDPSQDVLALSQLFGSLPRFIHPDVDPLLKKLTTHPPLSARGWADELGWVLQNSPSPEGEASTLLERIRQRGY